MENDKNLLDQISRIADFQTKIIKIAFILETFLKTFNHSAEQCHPISSDEKLQLIINHLMKDERYYEKFLEVYGKLDSNSSSASIVAQTKTTPEPERRKFKQVRRLRPIEPPKPSSLLKRKIEETENQKTPDSAKTSYEIEKEERDANRSIAYAIERIERDARAKHEYEKERIERDARTKHEYEKERKIRDAKKAIEYEKERKIRDTKRAIESTIERTKMIEREIESEIERETKRGKIRKEKEETKLPGISKDTACSVELQYLRLRQEVKEAKEQRKLREKEYLPFLEIQDILEKQT